MSVVGTASSSAGCPSQSRTGLGSIHGALSLLPDCGFSLPGDPLDRQLPEVTPQTMQPPGRQGYGGARPVSGFVELFVSDRYPRLRGFHESTLVSPLSARSIPASVGDPSAGSIGLQVLLFPWQKRWPRTLGGTRRTGHWVILPRWVGHSSGTTLCRLRHQLSSAKMALAMGNLCARSNLMPVLPISTGALHIRPPLSEQF